MCPLQVVDFRDAAPGSALVPRLLSVASVYTEIARATDEAMGRYAGGDDGAFRTVYAGARASLTVFFRRRLRDKARVPDLIQETFLRVHRARRTFRPGAAALPWILSIARHLLVDEHRLADPIDRLRRRQVPAEAAPTGEQMLLAEEAAARLGRAFDRLPEGQRAALRLVKSEGLSVAEAAAALGTTAAGIKLRTHKACRKLRAALGPTLAAA